MRRQERKGKSEWVVKKRNNEVLRSVWERDRPGQEAQPLEARAQP